MRVEDSESHFFHVIFSAVHAQDAVGSFNKMHAQAESERRHKGKIFIKFFRGQFTYYYRKVETFYDKKNLKLLVLRNVYDNRPFIRNFLALNYC